MSVSQWGLSLIGRISAVTVLSLVSTSSQHVRAASFDCKQAKTKVEHMICSDSDLSQLDDALAQAYSQAARSSENAPMLRADQSRWLEERAKCSTADCLVTLYRSRISRLSALRCMAKVRADTPAIENPLAVLKKGENWGPVTQVRVNRKTGEMSYCAHGDYCYRTSGVELFACTIKAKPDSEDADEWIYNPS